MYVCIHIYIYIYILFVYVKHVHTKLASTPLDVCIPMIALLAFSTFLVARGAPYDLCEELRAGSRPSRNEPHLLARRGLVVAVHACARARVCACTRARARPVEYGVLAQARA